MSEKRFVQLGDTSIKDTFTDEEWYAPCEDGLLETLNNLHQENQQLKEENKELRKKYSECEKFRYYVFEQLGKIHDEKNKNLIKR